MCIAAADLDYMLAARFGQMDRRYGIPMAEFEKLGTECVIASAQMNFRYSLVLGDGMTVRCWIEKFSFIALRFQFEINRRLDDKRACDGWFDCGVI
jgi:acyl-CoA thioesterase FadM